MSLVFISFLPSSLCPPISVFVDRRGSACSSISIVMMNGHIGLLCNYSGLSVYVPPLFLSWLCVHLARGTRLCVVNSVSLHFHSTRMCFVPASIAVNSCSLLLSNEILTFSNCLFFVQVFDTLRKIMRLSMAEFVSFNKGEAPKDSTEGADPAVGTASAVSKSFAELMESLEPFIVQAVKGRQRNTVQLHQAFV